MTAALAVRRRVVVHGVVQGVGFRPFVWGLATELGLAGFVGNDASGVFIEVEGPADDVARFVDHLEHRPPTLAVVDEVRVEPLAPVGDGGFRIVESPRGAVGVATTLVPPDVATCDDCLRELLDPADRRHRYPFVNCTACGPRFTIIRELPYDRPATTMAGFPMCADCEREYHDPADRRFHAQPVACPACGPQVRLTDVSGTVLAERDAAVAGAQRALAEGRIVAVKGVGGFHLACDATNERAVARLRAAKRRSAKPFAVMARDLDAVASFAVFGDGEEALLTGRQRPVVLLAARPGATVPPLVAPGNGRVGVMLPYSPLHHLLLDGPTPVLVMTSGNQADEPIAIDDEEALERLALMADVFLLHDRPIHVPCDDSVVRSLRGAELPVRRSRGYAPFPVRLPVEVAPTLAAGGELKTTFCLAAGRHAWLSQHLGDMGSYETLQAFERSAQQFQELYRVRPERLAADAHPGYTTSRWAAERGRATATPVVEVQHHHAHVASLMAEHGLEPDARVIGFAFDGTGYGADGAIWGGEVLVAGYAGFERSAHLAYVPLPGGDAAVRHPARVALAHLHAAGVAWDERLAPVAATSEEGRRVLARQLDTGFGCVPTSSMGRLFDAVAALAGICQEAGYEAQAAIELEALVCGPADRPYRFAVVEGAPLQLDPAPVVAAVVADVLAGTAPALVAARFHDAVADAVAELVERLGSSTGLRTVGLTGGVFQNVTLTERVFDRLTSGGWTVLTHRLVPPNDGGLALGQAVVAGMRAWDEQRG